MAHRARSKGTLTLPGIDCGLCGQRTCKSFAVQVYKGFARLDRCPQLGRQGTSLAASGACVGGAGLAKPSWKDSLGRRYDLLLEPFPGDPGPRETILPHNPLLVKTLRIKEGDLLLGRPMGGCGCPVTHCGTVLKADARNGILVWQVTGPLALRTKGFKDIGYYGTQSYEGIVTHSRQVLRLGMRYWFLPRYCMLQWRHSGLVNSLSHNAGRTEVRLEGIFVG